MTYDALIKIARLVTVDLINGDPIREDITLYQRGGLELNPGAPVLVDHDRGRPPIGHVLGLVEFADVDGEWAWARTVITDPPSWLKHGTKASVSFAALAHGGMRGFEWIHRGLVTEVSILSPGVRPSDPLACVALLRETSSPAAGLPSDRFAAGDTVLAAARIVRHNVGRVLGVR